MLKRIKLGIGGAIISLASLLSPAKADYIWKEYNGHQYALTENYGSWQMCENEATSMGGHLVTINDANENNWLVESFDGTYLQDRFAEPYPDSPNPLKYPTNPPDRNASIAWIGYGQTNAELGDWGWIDGDASSFNAPLFDYFYYPHVHGGLHMAIYLSSPYDGMWNNSPALDEASIHFPKGIIERTPEPSSTLLALLGIPLLSKRRRV